MPKVVWKTPEQLGWTLISEFPEYSKQVWINDKGEKQIVDANFTVPVME